MFLLFTFANDIFCFVGDVMERIGNRGNWKGKGKKWRMMDLFWIVYLASGGCKIGVFLFSSYCHAMKVVQSTKSMEIKVRLKMKPSKMYVHRKGDLP